ncbi:MAG: hypothetical protein E6I22_09950 [Chloroflexi bacterium]|nr:MAG: hypothetical protein E6I22_09950 [Chloroflexota bacterium]
MTRCPVRRRAGQSLVEMALVLPVLAFLTFGLLDFGRAYYYQVSITNAAREGARTAILNIYVGPLTPTCTSSNTIVGAVNTELQGTGITPASIQICPPHDQSMSTIGCPNNNNRVDLWNAGQNSAYYVNVIVKYNFQLYTPR